MRINLEGLHYKVVHDVLEIESEVVLPPLIREDAMKELGRVYGLKLVDRICDEVSDLAAAEICLHVLRTRIE